MSANWQNRTSKPGDLIRNEWPLSAYSVEKLCFEMSGDFICDLSRIAYCMYEGGSRSRMKIRPDATQDGTTDL